MVALGPSTTSSGTTIRSVGVGASSRAVHRWPCAGPTVQGCPCVSGVVQRLGSIGSTYRWALSTITTAVNRLDKALKAAPMMTAQALIHAAVLALQRSSPGQPRGDRRPTRRQLAFTASMLAAMSSFASLQIAVIGRRWAAEGEHARFETVRAPLFGETRRDADARRQGRECSLSQAVA